MAAAARSRGAVFKSGPLFISSKGIGWKSWKKRWFILTRTSLVFFKSDPTTLPQRGGEVNLTLGGIDLNNSGSVVVRKDKKQLTILFPDGRDGRAFHLKAETSEDLFEWKTALEEALAQAPNAAMVIGHDGIFRNDTTDAYEGAAPNWREKRPIKSLVVRRPILLALEDIDGSPSILEKALCFLEKHGIKVEGILCQAADVEEVDRRMNEYEQGRTEFALDEDAHVVGDCVKHVLRELSSSPVPASCCTALLEAFRLESKESRINSIRAAISETFPEPNRRLLQRILRMMHTVASHSAENRMTPSAVAACMAPLLLRSLLADECEMEDDIDMNGDNSAQLIAANSQAIVTTLLEEYERIFDDEHPRCSLSPDSRIQDSGSEEPTEDETVDAKDNGFQDAGDADQELDERLLSGKLSESSACTGGDLYNYQTESKPHMPLQYLKAITNNFCNERILGKGGFGVVYKGLLENGEMVAVKKLLHAMPSSQKQFENEVDLLMKIEHPNIVRLLGYCYETQHLHTYHKGKSVFAWNTESLLCLECLPNGSLDNYISDASSGLDWHTRCKIIEGISYGLQYLHEHSSDPIIHLDLKPANILLDGNMLPKITDFGLSRLFDQAQTIHTAITSGTLGYMPPEFLRGIITPMSDIFSLGVIIMEVITGHRDYPYDIRKSSKSFIELELQKWRNTLQKNPGYISTEVDCQQIERFIQVGLICVNPERARRPTMKKVIDMLQGSESMIWHIHNELSSHGNQDEP